MGKQPEPTTIDEYINKICSRMKALPSAEVDELRQEIHQHLQSLVTAAEVMGYSHDEAVRMALSRFGSSSTIAREILYVSLRLQTLQFAKLFLRYAIGLMPFAMIVIPMSYALDYCHDSLWSMKGYWGEILVLSCIVGSIDAGIQWACQYLEIRLEYSHNADTLATTLSAELGRGIFVKKIGYVMNSYHTHKVTRETFISLIGWILLIQFIPDIFFQKLFFVIGVESAVATVLLSYIQRSQLQRLAGR